MGPWTATVRLSRYSALAFGSPTYKGGGGPGPQTDVSYLVRYSTQQRRKTTGWSGGNGIAWKKKRTWWLREAGGAAGRILTHANVDLLHSQSYRILRGAGTHNCTYLTENIQHMAGPRAYLDISFDPDYQLTLERCNYTTLGGKKLLLSRTPGRKTSMVHGRFALKLLRIESI